MRLLVADASALVEYLLDPARTPNARRLIEAAETDLHVPALCDLEVVAALRRALRWPRTPLDQGRAKEVLEDYAVLPLTRHEHLSLLEGIFELRDNFTVYDASYAVLAEQLGAELLTADSRFASAVRAHLRLRVHGTV